MKRPNFFKGHASGQSFAEFALILPVLFTLLAGTIDLGRFFLSYMELRDAAQEGANYASIYANSDPATADQFVANVTGRVQSSAQYPLNLSAVTVNVTPSSGLCTGSAVKVTVHYLFPITAPFVGIFFNDQNIPMSIEMDSIVLMPGC